MHLNFLIVEVIRRIGIPVFLKGRIIMFTDGKCTSTSIRQDVAMLQSCRANLKAVVSRKNPDDQKRPKQISIQTKIIEPYDTELNTITVIENKNFEPVLCIIEPVG